MEIKKNLSSKIIAFILGIFLTTLTLQTLIKQFQTTGFWLAFILSILAIFIGFYKYKKNSYQRILSYGILSSLLLLITLYIILKQSIQLGLG